MAYPSGSGTEVLRRMRMNSASSTETAFRWDATDPSIGTDSYTVPANCMVTILNITFQEQGNAAENFNLYITPSWGGVVFLLREQALAGYGDPFIWNDKFMLLAGDRMTFVTENAASIDIWCSYLFTDWT